MMLAIKEAASDMSPYVRKTAAHAIPKLYRYVPNLALHSSGGGPKPPTHPPPRLSQVLQIALLLLYFGWFETVWGTARDGGQCWWQSHVYQEGWGGAREHSVSRYWEGRGGRIVNRKRFSFSLDSDQKDQLIEVIEKLLADKTTVCT